MPTSSVTTSEPSNRPFKVGDKVVVKSKVDRSDEVGYTFAIETIGPVGLCCDKRGRCYTLGQLRHAKYEPAVGDVVELTDGHKAIVYEDTSGWCCMTDVGYWATLKPNGCCKLTVSHKVSVTGCLNGETSAHSVRSIAKAYFAEQDKKP